MDELSNPKLQRPLDKSNLGTEVAALNSLVGFLNTGAVVPPEAKEEIAAAFHKTPSPVQEQGAPIAPPAARPPNPVAPLGRRIFFTGRMCSGKDFVANQIGADIFGFADPIYSLAEYLLNIKVTANENKDAPGVRKFLQQVGQWGRNEISEQYPHTAERAMFCMMVRSLANQNCLGPGVDWGIFGLTADLWIDGLLKRADAVNSNRIVVTNCRFPNEYRRLSEANFEHWHIVCSPQSWLSRLAEKKLDAKSPEVSDMSEKLAADLNADLLKKMSAQKVGNKMRVVWSDTTPPPSNRVYSLDEFKALAN